MRPYSDAPCRADAILGALRGWGSADIVPPHAYPLDPIRAVHDGAYLYYLEQVYGTWIAEGGPETGVVPHAFAVRDMAKKPDSLTRQVGYYCFDAQTPIVEHTYEAALSSAHCALTGAEMLLSGEAAVYALCRPPGHHAGRSLYGGYCYLNNAAIAARYLSRKGRVAILDLDYHHGNGTQEVFYDSEEILFISIHGDPHRTYPFFSGFADEQGIGAGRGLTCNFPLAAPTDQVHYLAVLDRAGDILHRFAPVFLVFLDS